MNPSVQSIGTSKRIRPRYMVNSQLKILAPVGMEMIMVVIPKNELTFAPEPIVKKWCSQTRKDRMVIDDGRVDHRGVAKQPLAAESRDDFGEDPKCGQDQDVHLGMSPDPDQVDVHHGVAAQIVGEEIRTEIAVEGSSASAAVSTGKAATIRTLVHSAVQVKMGIFISVMPGARILRMVAIKLIAGQHRA